MRDHRGITLIELMLLMVMLGTVVTALVTRSWRPFGFLVFVYGALFVVLLGLSTWMAWRLRISLPRLLRTLDRLEKENDRGESATLAIARFRDLLTWLPLDRGMNVLQARIDREGPFRREYLRLVETFLWSEPARELLERIAYSADPLAAEARDLLALRKGRQES